MNGWQATAAALCIVTGTVFDAQHQPVAEAKVYLQGTSKAFMAQTDAAGVYKISVPSGSYTFYAEGEAATERATVKPDQTMTVDLTLAPAYFDEPTFTVAGVTDNTYRGGHGSDTVLRSAESLTKATAALGAEERPDPLAAVREYQKAALADPSEVNLFNWGTELLRHGAARTAIPVFADGVRRFPRSTRMVLGLATAQYDAGSYESAAEWYFKATDLVPGDPIAYGFLAKVEAKQITTSKGYEERMARFVKLQPNNALAHYYYGVALLNQGHGEQAAALFAKAIALDPQLAPAHLQLGIMEAQKSNYVEAARDYERAIAADPMLEEAHYRLAEAYRVLGDAGKAKEEMATYRRLSKESAERTETERRDNLRFVQAAQ